MMRILCIIWILCVVPIVATEYDLIKSMLSKKESAISSTLYMAFKEHVFVDTCSKNITGLTIDNYLDYLKTDDSIIVMNRDNNILTDIDKKADDRFIGTHKNIKYYVVVSDIPPLDQIYCGFKISSECKHDTAFTYAKCLLLYLN